MWIEFDLSSLHLPCGHEFTGCGVLRVLQRDAHRVELGADAVGLGEVLRLARGGAGGDRAGIAFSASSIATIGRSPRRRLFAECCRSRSSKCAAEPIRKLASHNRRGRCVQQLVNAAIASWRVQIVARAHRGPVARALARVDRSLRSSHTNVAVSSFFHVACTVQSIGCR